MQIPLGQTVARRLRAGALVIVVQDADETLALAEVEAGANACGPVRIMSGADESATGAVEEHAEGAGTLVLCDFLSIYGESPVTIRLLRQVALQQRPEGQAFSRLILIERPDTPISPALAGDVEVVSAELPTVDELTAELDGFLEAQPNASPEGNGETRYAVATAGAGLARHEFSRLLARSVIENGELDPGWIRQEKALRVATKLSGALTFDSVDGADVGGLENLREWLNNRMQAFGSRKAREFGLPEPKGIILGGVPGCAKTLTARAIARKQQLPLLRLDCGKLFGSLVGQSESQTAQAIAAIEACAPCVLLIDEIEKGLAGIGNGGGSGDSGTTQRVGQALLTWLNDRTSAVFVVGTANRMESLPPELLRPGRVDCIFTVDLPTATERAEIAAIHLARRNRDLGPDAPAAIAAATKDFSGAEIEQSIVDGLFAAYEAGRDLELGDVLAAAGDRTPLAKTAPEDIKRIREWGKSGRARPASKPDDTPNPAVVRGPKLQ